MFFPLTSTTLRISVFNGFYDGFCIYTKILQRSRSYKNDLIWRCVLPQVVMTSKALLYLKQPSQQPTVCYRTEPLKCLSLAATTRSFPFSPWALFKPQRISTWSPPPWSFSFQWLAAHCIPVKCSSSRELFSVWESPKHAGGVKTFSSTIKRQSNELWALPQLQRRQ